jgi:HD-GYP domain-containing protein (c-di-GMP phosphodiesterase class II)
VVNASAPGPWSATWYALVPAGAARPLVARAIANAFADLDAAGQRARLERELGELNAIGIQLSAERNLDVLLDTILTKAREITRADGGSLYLVEENADGPPRLRFTVAQCESVDIPFRAVSLPLDHKSVAGYVALTGAIVNLADAYTPPVDSPFQINRWFDDNAGYRTKSMLVVPMRTPQGETIGALQLINCKLDAVDVLRTLAETEQSVRAFDASHERLAGSLASQAAVAIANRRLYESISQLFDGFVKASVTAIESRDPTTFGHSFRVADLTVGLAEVVDRCDTGPYRGLRFTAEELRELRYASLLHDFGKVGVREHVLVKAKKLYEHERELILQRFQLIKRGYKIEGLESKVRYLAEASREQVAAQIDAIDADLAGKVAEIDDIIRFILSSNEPTVLDQGGFERVAVIAGMHWRDDDGKLAPYLTAAEAGCLQIRRGSLTEQERVEINSHVVHSYNFLRRIPWSRTLRDVPDIAGSHHEKLDGTGYPNALRGEQIPIPARMMAISDIYDALTASDRPYKRAMPMDKALDILASDVKRGQLDSDLFNIFIAAQVWSRPPRSN